MCGRYVSKVEADLERYWGLRRPPPLFESYNVSPSMEVPVVRRSLTGEREAVLMRWGLIPFWSHGVAPRYTAERVQTAPAFRGPWKRGQRCLFPVNGFYEWQQVPGHRTKQPWYIRLRDENVFALGGLWDSSKKEDGTVVESCTIITVPANPMLSTIHNTKKRMPLIVSLKDYDAWLATDGDTATAVIEPYPDSKMVSWPVSTYVNNPRHDDERCIAKSA